MASRHLSTQTCPARVDASTRAVGQYRERHDRILQRGGKITAGETTSWYPNTVAYPSGSSASSVYEASEEVCHLGWTSQRGRVLRKFVDRTPAFALQTLAWLPAPGAPYQRQALASGRRG